MSGLNKLTENVWIIMLVLSMIFIAVTLFIMSNGNNIFPTALKIAGSSQNTEDIEGKALAFINMSMLKPLWEGVWMGVFGIVIALGLKKEVPEIQKYAWTLGLIWGIMMLSNAVIQGGYEILILGWSMVCVQTFSFLFLGVVALVSLLITRKEFT